MHGSRRRDSSGRSTRSVASPRAKLKRGLGSTEDQHLRTHPPTHEVATCHMGLLSCRKARNGARPRRRVLGARSRTGAQRGARQGARPSRGAGRTHQPCRGTRTAAGAGCIGYIEGGGKGESEPLLENTGRERREPAAVAVRSGASTQPAAAARRRRRRRRRQCAMVVGSLPLGLTGSRSPDRECPGQAGRARTTRDGRQRTRICAAELGRGVEKAGWGADSVSDTLIGNSANPTRHHGTRAHTARAEPPARSLAGLGCWLLKPQFSPLHSCLRRPVKFSPVHAHSGSGSGSGSGLGQPQEQIKGEIG